MTTDPSDKKTFDMYHFISRKDTLAAAVVIVVLLILAGAPLFRRGSQGLKLTGLSSHCRGYLLSTTRAPHPLGWSASARPVGC